MVRYLPAYKQTPERLKSTLLTLALLLIGVSGLCAAAACLVPSWRPQRSMIAAAWLVLSMQGASVRPVQRTCTGVTAPHGGSWR